MGIDAEIFRLRMMARMPAAKRKFRRKTEPKFVGAAPILSSGEMYDLIESDRAGRKTAHIICSGWSASLSQSVIRDEDAVFGFNLAGLLPLKFDFFYCEGGGSTHPDMEPYTPIQDHMFSIMTSKPRMFIKNLWEDKFDYEYIRKMPFDPVMIRDLELPAATQFQPTERDKIIAERLITPSRDFLWVYGTTSITCAIIAAMTGFEKVVFHGFDFSGPHFYAEAAFPLAPEIADQTRALFPDIPRTQDHGAGRLSRRFLPSLRDSMARRGVTLCAADARSPSASILPVLELAEAA